jgi:hypothetical protein
VITLEFLEILLVMKYSAPRLVAALSLLALTAGSTTLTYAAEPSSGKNAVINAEGVIPQIATGGGSFYMDFQFVNSSALPATVTLTFFDSDGVPMAVPYVQDGIESTATTLVETVAPGGVEFARTLFDAPDVQVGYAEVVSSIFYAITVQSTFTQVVPDRPLFRAFIPEDKNTNKGRFFLPSIDTGSQTSSMAVVSGVAQSVSYIARNRNGVELCNSGRPFLKGEHRAFIIRDMLPCLAGVDGIVEVVGSEGERIFGVGITAEDSGAFVTQPPVDPVLLLF